MSKKKIPWNKGLKGEEYKEYYKNGFKGIVDKYELAYDKNWLAEQHYGFNLKTTDMAKKLGCSRKTIVNGLNKNNIPIRETRCIIEPWIRDKKGRKKCPNCKKWLSIKEYCKDERRTDGLDWICKKCKWNKRDIARITNRIIALQIYTNGTMKCEECGYENIDALAFDQINNDGNQHRKKIKNMRIVRWMKQNNYPLIFRVLCRNCNWLDRLKK